MQPCWLTSFNGPAADTKSEVVSAFHSIAWLSAIKAAHGECQIESRAFTRMQLVVVNRKAAGCQVVMGVRYPLCKSWLMAKGVICA